jgi:RimJ/RimL family protein N-acetyltransferase
VHLRPLTEQDFAEAAAWGDDPEVEAHFGKVFATAAEREAFRQQRTKGRRCAMGVDLQGVGLIGVIELVDLNWRARSAELCVYIGEERHRGRGYGTAAVLGALEVAFGQLELRRLYLRVARANRRACRCYVRCGFKLRGTLPVSRRQPERTDELALMELTKDEFFARCPRPNRSRRLRPEPAAAR